MDYWTLLNLQRAPLLYRSLGGHSIKPWVACASLTLVLCTANFTSTRSTRTSMYIPRPQTSESSRCQCPPSVAPGQNDPSSKIRRRQSLHSPVRDAAATGRGGAMRNGTTAFHVFKVRSCTYLQPYLRYITVATPDKVCTSSCGSALRTGGEGEIAGRVARSFHKVRAGQPFRLPRHTSSPNFPSHSPEVSNSPLQK